MPYGGNKFHLKAKAPGEEEVKVIRNWPKVIDGIKYDSPLEHYMAELLRQHKINFEFKRKYVLFKSFSYGGDTVIGLTLTVDFFFPDHNIIGDTKGNQNEGNPIKWKMLKRYLVSKGECPRIMFYYSQKECREFVLGLRYGFTEQIKEGTVNTRIKKLKRVSKLIGQEFFNSQGNVICKLNDLKIMPAYDYDKLLKSLS